MGEVDSAEGLGTLLEAQVVALSDPCLEEDLSEGLARTRSMMGRCRKPAR